MSSKKTYWKGYSEKNQTPTFVESSQKEFQEKIPVDEFLSSDGVNDLKSGRRDFLKFMGFSVAAATLASCETPVIKSIPYVNKPEEITPGVANWYSSTFYDGNDFANILVKSREGRPIWLKGKKDGMSAGGLIPRISTSILNLYNSARLENPLLDKAETTWDDSDSKIKKQLSDIAASNGKIRILTNTIISPSTNAAIKDFIGAYSKNDTESEIESDIKHIQYDPKSYNGIRIANESSFGASVIPNYHFDKAKIIVSISADFISNWLLPTKYSTDYSKSRKPENGWMSKHYQFESVFSLTGANADYRSQIKPSQEGITASSILSVLKGGNPNEMLSEETAANIVKCAKSLKENKGNSIVVSGSNDSNIQTIVNAINVELGNYDSTIDLANPLNLFQGNDEEVSNLISEIESNKVEALIVYGSNPVYSLPNGVDLAKSISKIPLTISLSEYEDETASVCKFVCPDHNYLESWCDHEPINGHVSIQQPIIRPLYNTRQAQESFLVWAGLAERAINESQAFYDYIRENWTSKSIGNQEDYMTFTEFWNWTIHNGYTNTSNINSELDSVDHSSYKNDISSSEKAVLDLASSTGDWEYIVYQKELGLGAHAANPWLQELPDSITKVVWDNYITMAPADCYELFNINTNDPKSSWDGIHLGQEEKAFMVSLTANGSEIKLPVYPLPGQTKGTVGVSFGYGRGESGENIGKAAFQCDEKGDHLVDANDQLLPIGANGFKLASFSGNNLSYNGVAEIALLDERYSLASTQTHHTVMGRTSIVKETSYDFWKANSDNKEAYNEKVKLHSHKEGGHSEVDATEFSLWDEHPVENVGHRWGMSIDLSSCNGCGVCITACHSENNVPVVGKDEVRRSRDMHWLRMDRYFSSIEDDNRKEWAEAKHKGDFDYGKLEVPEDNPSVVFMPMLCQHCNHAPCETVCPVAATTHSNEGLNMMTYNRCIGTRYCANNCPYKVRRFNWFNYRDYRKFKNANPSQDEMARLVLNPDVVVRSRGVMEKCSFCVQRIQEGKLTAKKEARTLNDGDVVTACSDACPNDCITFGDWNDPSSEIKAASESSRSYQALEEVGVKPNVWYQVKVRNIDEENTVAHLANDEHHNEH